MLAATTHLGPIFNRKLRTFGKYYQVPNQIGGKSANQLRGL